MAPFLEAARKAQVQFESILGPNQRAFKAAIERLNAITPLSQNVNAVIEKIGRIELETRRLDSAGWLPHYTTPFDILRNTTLQGDELGQAIEEYYHSNWGNVVLQIQERLARYCIDDEAKAVHREALAAHKAGHYRSTVRLLFPEIERVARLALHNGSLEVSITSQHALRNLAGSMGLGDIEPPGYYSLNLFKKLDDHLYAKVTSKTLENIQRDRVPNRHAAIHGVVMYSSFQNSMNTMIMAEYVWQIIDSIKHSESDPVSTQRDECQ